MRRIVWICVAVLLTVGGLAHAQQVGRPTLPDSVVLLAELGSVQSLDGKVAAVVGQIAPEAQVPPMAMMMPMAVFKTMDPTAVDLTRPVQVVILAPPLERKPVVVFSVTDADRYMDALMPNLQKTASMGNIHLLEEAAWGDPDGQGKQVVIGIEGNRAAMGGDVAAVTAVVALIKEGALPAESAFPGRDVGATLRVKALMAALGAQGQSPFDELREGLAELPMPPQPGPDPRVMFGVMLDAAESLAAQVDVLTLAADIDADAIVVHSRMAAVEGSGLASYFAQLPEGDLDLLDKLPADAVLVGASKVGDLTPLIDVYMKFLAAIGGGDADMTALEDLMSKAYAAMGDEMAAAYSLDENGAIVALSVAKVKDVDAMKAVFESAPDAMASVNSVYEGLGMKMSLALTPAALTHGGRQIDEWDFDYEFGGLPGMPSGEDAPPGAPSGEQMAALQNRVVKAFTGEEGKGYGAFMDDVYAYAQGANALEALKGVIDGGPSAADAAETKAATDVPGRIVSIVHCSFEKLLGAYLKLVTEAMSEGGAAFPLAPMLANVQFEEGPPIVAVSWMADDGAAHDRVRLPVSAFKNVVDGFTQAFTPPAGAGEGEWEESWDESW